MNRARLDEIYTHLDQALAEDRPHIIEFDDASHARAFRMEIYAAIRKSRGDSKKLYAEGDPGWGTSEYDDLRISLVGRTLQIAPHHPIPKLKIAEPSDGL